MRIERFTGVKVIWFTAAALVSAAAVVLVAPHPRLFAQSQVPDLVGRWTLEAQGYEYPDVRDRGGKPELQQIPSGLIFLEITAQNDRVFAGRLSCPGDECAGSMTGAVGEAGEIAMVLSDGSDYNTVSGKLSAGEDSLVMSGIVTSVEDLARATSPGISTMRFIARKMR